MISGPIVDDFYFWRRRSLLKREIIAQNISHNSWSQDMKKKNVYLVKGGIQHDHYSIGQTNYTTLQ